MQAMEIVTPFIAGLLAFGLGALWYSPILFGNQWQRLGNHTPQTNWSRTKMIRYYGIGLLATIITAYVFAYVDSMVMTLNLGQTFLVAFALWLGFSATARVGSVLWENRPWKYAAITAGYELVSLLLIALIVQVMLG